MDSRGNLQANNFLLPQVPVAQSQTPQPYNDGIQALQDLQHVKGQTSDYYTKVMGLKSFMHNVQSNLGIDVRVPDMSRPESVRLHQIYNTALADILGQGNLLHNSRATQMARENRGDIYAPGVDPNAQAADTLAYGQDVFGKAAQPNVMEANNQTQQVSTDDIAYAQKQKLYEDKIAEFDAASAADPSRKAYNDYQKSILTPPARAIKQFAPQREYSYQDRKAGRMTKNAGEFLKKITNISAGAHDSFTASPNDLNENGKPYLKSKEFAGDKFGADQDGKPLVISHWLFDPDSRESILVLKNGEKIPVGNDPSSISRTLLGSNSSTYGVDAEYIDAWIDSQKDLRDQFGQVDKNKLLGADYIAKQDQKVKEAEKLSKTSGPAVDALTEKIKSMKSTMIGRNDVVNAGKFEIEKNWGDDAYIVRNIGNVFPPASFKNKEAANKFYSSFKKWPDNDPEKLVKWLIKNGAHVEDYKAANGTNVAPTTQTNAVDTQYKTSNGQSYTRAELKGAGWTDEQIDALQQ